MVPAGSTRTPFIERVTKPSGEVVAVYKEKVLAADGTVLSISFVKEIIEEFPKPPPEIPKNDPPPPRVPQERPMLRTPEPVERPRLQPSRQVTRDPAPIQIRSLRPAQNLASLRAMMTPSQAAPTPKPSAGLGMDKLALSMFANTRPMAQIPLTQVPTASRPAATFAAFSGGWSASAASAAPSASPGGGPV